MFVNTEKKLIWKNGSFKNWNESNVHILSHTLHYGTGVFEGVRAYKTSNGAAIFRLKKHTNYNGFGYYLAEPIFVGLSEPTKRQQMLESIAMAEVPRALGLGRI